MPRSKIVYGWLDRGVYYASLQPKDANGPRNQYDKAIDIVADANARGMKVQWQSEVD